MKQITTLFVLALTISATLYAQTVRPEIKRLVDGIAEDNIVKSSAVGIAGSQSDQWNRYISLKEKATNEELIALTDHTNGAVRCYSFQALATRKNINVYSILIRHLYDTALVTIFQGCLLGSETIGDYFLKVVTDPYNDGETCKLNEIERQKVDSILIFDKNIKLSARSDVLKILYPDEKYYKRVREIVTVEKDNYGLIALSRYQNQNDKDIIIERLISNKPKVQYYGLLAVKHFPDSSFFTYIVKIHSVEIEKSTSMYIPLLRILYQAIVQYKNLESRSLLELSLSKESKYASKYHSEYIWLALDLYPDNVYYGIQQKINISSSSKSELQFWINNTD
ncbi:hypothetical protein GC194_03275 [bacterium]|nr:hypothetical protein [bacterium]